MNRRHLTTALLTAALALTVPATTADARPGTPRVCFPATATQNLRQVIPVVPGYCLVSVRHGKPEPGTVNRGVLRYRGKGHATVTIYRQGAWHWYGYRKAQPRTYWEPVSQEFGDALAEGESSPPESADTRDWEACLTNRTHTIVVCPDGFTTTL